MNNNDIRRFIVSMVGITNYRKAANYPKHYIEYEGHEVKGNKVYFTFNVESESSYRYYEVNFYKKGDVIACRCSCPQYG